MNGFFFFAFSFLMCMSANTRVRTDVLSRTSVYRSNKTVACVIISIIEEKKATRKLFFFIPR